MIRRHLASALAGALLALAALPGASRADGGLEADGGFKNVVYVAAADEAGAMKALRLLERAERDELIVNVAYAIVSRDAQGNLEVNDERRKKAPAEDVASRPGLRGLVALMGGLAGFAIGRDSGAALGYTTGTSFGPPGDVTPTVKPPSRPDPLDGRVEQLKHDVPPGRWALVAVIEERAAADPVVDVGKLRAREALEQEVPVVKD